MPKIREVRASIDQTLDRWEAAALALEANVQANLTTVSERIKTQKEKLAEASEGLKLAIAHAQQLPSDTKEKIAGDLDHLKVQLALGKAEARDAVAAQENNIKQAVQRLENRIDGVEQKFDQNIEEAVEKWTRAELELRQEFELATLRFENEKAEKHAKFEAKKQEMLDKVKQFRGELDEKRTTALQKGSSFASDMNAAFEQARDAFRNLAA